MARREDRAQGQPPNDAEQIALRVHQLAATAGALAVAAGRIEDDGRSMAHALHLIEECLLDVEKRMLSLRA